MALIAGTYVIEVGDVGFGPVPSGSDYTLHVSSAGHAATGILDTFITEAEPNEANLEVEISLAGKNVTGATGLAKDTDGNLWALLKVQGQTGRELAQVDTTTGIAASTGNTGDNFAGIVFTGTSLATEQLWGVTGDGATVPETLHLFNTKFNAASHIPALTLGNGANGEAIGLHDTDGKIYHMSGNTHEKINLAGPSIEPISLAVAGTLNIMGGNYDGSAGDGVQVDSAQNIVIQPDAGATGSTFDSNGDNGLRVGATGSLNISGATFDVNGANGIFVDDSGGVVTLTNVSAAINSEDGVKIASATSVTVNGGDFSGNTTDDGLDLDDVSGAVTLTGVTADGNEDDGVKVDGAGSVKIDGGSFDGNVTGDGIDLENVSGNVELLKVSADGGNDPGAEFENIGGNVDILCGTFNGNTNEGISIQGVEGDVTIRKDDTCGGTSVAGNGTEGISVLSPDHPFSGVSTLVHSTGDNFLLVEFTDLYQIDVNGSTTLLGELDHVSAGLAFLGGKLYSVDEFSSTIHEIDPATGTTLSSLTVDLPVGTIDGFNGLANLGGTLLALADLPGVFGHQLISIDPGAADMGVVTAGNIGNTFDKLTDLAANGSTLYGVTGDDASNPDSLFSINTSNGWATIMGTTLANSALDGQAGIAIYDGDLFHATGGIFESFSGTGGTGTDIPAPGIQGNLDISNATITGNDIGVFLENFPGTATISNSTISGNSTGVDNDGALQVEASGNWWGDASGPDGGGNPSAGNGDEVAGNVNVLPFLARTPTMPPFTSKVNVYFDADGTGDASAPVLIAIAETIQQGVDAAADGATPAHSIVDVIPNGAFVEDVEIFSKTLTLRGGATLESAAGVALTVDDGSGDMVNIENMTIVGKHAADTIVLDGGTVSIRGTRIVETMMGDFAGIEVNNGTNLNVGNGGTDPGNNTFVVQGETPPGDITDDLAIDVNNGNNVPALGNTWQEIRKDTAGDQLAAVTLGNPGIEGVVDHVFDDATQGLVMRQALGTGICQFVGVDLANTHAANAGQLQGCVDAVFGAGGDTLVIEATGENPADLQTALDAVQGAVSDGVAPDPDTQLVNDDLIDQLKALTAPAGPFTIVLDLNGQTAIDGLTGKTPAGDAGVMVPSGVTFEVTDGTLQGGSPAFFLSMGNVFLNGITAETDAPDDTILVEGGFLKMRGSTVHESTVSTRVGIVFQGLAEEGDLGMIADKGLNTFIIHPNNGSDRFGDNLVTSPGTIDIPAYGNTWRLDGQPNLTLPADIEARITDKDDFGSFGQFLFNSPPMVDVLEVAVPEGSGVTGTAETMDMDDMANAHTTTTLTGGPNLDPGFTFITSGPNIGDYSYNPGGAGADDDMNSKTDAFTYTVNDTDETSTGTITFRITNVAPTVTAIGDVASHAENMAFSGKVANFTDPGTLDTHTAVINWGDGTTTAGTIASGMVTGTHLFPDDRAEPYTVTVQVFDDDHKATVDGLGSDTFTVKVDNAAPIVDAGADFMTNEGSITPLMVNFTDGTADTHTAVIDWGDGTTDNIGAVTSPFTANHTYADDGDYQVKVTVTDDEGSSGMDLVDVNVKNVGPVVDAAPDELTGDIMEAMAFTIAPIANFDDPGADEELFTATIDWGDGSAVESGTIPAATPTSAGNMQGNTVVGSHEYAQEGDYTVTIKVTDNEGAMGSDTMIIRVSNKPPANINRLTLPSIKEGKDSMIEFFTFTDVTPETFTAEIVWGDGTTTTGTVLGDNELATVKGTHTYADDRQNANDYAVTVNVSDGTDTVSETFNLDVDNDMPVVDAGPDISGIRENQSITIMPMFTDPAGSEDDNFSGIVNWGDGGGDEVIAFNSLTHADGNFKASHAYATPGDYIVTVTVNDGERADAGDMPDGTDTLVIRVAPPVEAGLSLNMFEGMKVLLNGANFLGLDPARAAVVVDWGDGSTPDTGSLSDPDSAVTITPTGADTADLMAMHTYEDGANPSTTYTITVTVFENLPTGVAEYGRDTTTAVILNANPMVEANANGLVQINEGDELSSKLTPSGILASFTDKGGIQDYDGTTAVPSPGVPKAEADFGDGAGFEDVILNVGAALPGHVIGTHTYRDNGVFAVQVQVTDDDGGVGNDVFLVEVTNVAPVVDAGADMTMGEGVALNFVGNFTDAGADDTHSGTIDWGDSSNEAAVITEADGTGTASATHTYANEGTFTITLTVTDDDGASHTDTKVVTISNSAPVVDAGGDMTMNESENVAVSGTFTDAGAGDTHTASIDWGDGTVDPVAASGGVVTGLHPYADNGTYTVTVTVTDNSNVSGTDTKVVTINNVDPSVDLGADVSADEGDTVDLSGAITDPGSADTFTATIDWGDGSPPEAGTVTGSVVTGSHTYTNEGIFTAKVTVHDDDGGMGMDTKVVNVGNLAPIVDGADDFSGTEGTAVNVSSTFSDGADDTHTATIDFGDGSGPQAGTVTEAGGSGTAAGSHTYLDNGTYTITTKVTDDSGMMGTDTTVVTIGNANPVVTAGANRAGTEGSSVDMTGAGTFTDAGTLDTHTASIDPGDGSGPQAATIVGNSVNGSHTYTQDGTYTATVKVTDDDGGMGTSTFEVVVGNSDPVVEAGADSGAAEGATSTLSATFTDAGADTHTATVDWGDGTVDTVPATGGQVNAGHAYADDGTYTVKVTVMDGSGMGMDTKVVTVTNVDPTVDTSLSGMDEGDLVSMTGRITDPGSADTHTAVIDWGDGTTTAGVVNGLDVTGSHAYADDGNFVVTTTVTDDDGGVGSDTATTTVDNAAPLVNAGPDAAVLDGQAVPLTAAFTDKGIGDTHISSIDWGDGIVEPGSLTQGAGTGQVTAQHVYATPGTYIVTVTITDDDGGIGTDTKLVVVQKLVDLGGDMTMCNSDFHLSGIFIGLNPVEATVLIDWGDTSDVMLLTLLSGGVTMTGPLSGTFEADHDYMVDSGVFTINVSVIDITNPIVAVDSKVLTICNDPAVVNAGGNQSGAEGDTLFLSGVTFTDDPTDTHTATVDWGDGTGLQPAVVVESGGTGEVQASHVYVDNGTYTATITVIDSDGGPGTATKTFTIDNVSPAVDGGADKTALAGQPISLADPVTFTDQGSADTHTGTVAWGDGTVEPATFNAGKTLTNTHVYANDGDFVVTVTITDDDGGTGTDTLNVSVGNAAPTVNAGDDMVMVEGGTLNLAATFADASGDTHTATINWGDGSSEAGTVGAGAVTGSHVYPDNGSFIVTVTVTDDSGLSGSDSKLLVVTNAAPTVDAGADQTANEGATVSIAPTITDPGTNDTHTTTVNWGDGTVNSSLTHVYGDNGTFTVTVTSTDNDGASGNDTLTVNVANVGPGVNVDDFSGRVNVPVNLTASISDASGDTHTAQINWGDGTVEAGTVNQATGTITGSHTYTTEGDYTVTVTATDDDGGSGSDTALASIGTTAKVTDFSFTPSGFVVCFSRPMDPSEVDLYDGLDASNDIPDATLVRTDGAAPENIDGSLIWNDDNTKVWFVATGGTLDPGTYVSTLRSATDGFRDAAGDPLDGDGDDSPGGDRVDTFAITAARSIGVRDFMRGPGQDLDIDNSLNISISDATNVEGVSFILMYDPSNMDVDSLTLSPAAQAASWILSTNELAPGMIKVSAGGPGTLAGATALAVIEGGVPSGATYGDMHLIKITDVEINENLIAGVGDMAVHVVGYLGDASGNAAYLGLDPSLILRVDVGLDTGFDAWKQTDPAIIADVSGNGNVTALDAAITQQETLFVNFGNAAFDRSEIPPIPSSVVAASATGDDSDDASAAAFAELGGEDGGSSSDADANQSEADNALGSLAADDDDWDTGLLDLL